MIPQKEKAKSTYNLDGWLHTSTAYGTCPQAVTHPHSNRASVD